MGLKRKQEFLIFLVCVDCNIGNLIGKHLQIDESGLQSLLTNHA